MHLLHTEEIKAIGHIVIELTKLRIVQTPHLMIESFAPDLTQKLIQVFACAESTVVSSGFDDGAA